MLHLIHGENELQRREVLAEVIEQSGLTPDFRDMNTEILEGIVSPGDLLGACSVMPFLGEARIVIARDLLSKVKGKAAQELVAVFPDISPTTHLIFDESKTLPKRHAIFTKAKDANVRVRHCGLPDARALPSWVQQRTQAHGGRIEGRAAGLLAQNIGSNLRLLDQEIRKLLLYVGDRKEIAVDDVRVMVPYVQSADVIFQMVDAVGQRDGRRALSYLHRLLDVGEHPLGIFGMVVRQFRLLIQIRWLIDQRHTQQQITSRIKLHPYVVKKVCAQADRFTPTQLREAYRLLAEQDLAIKRGGIPADMALDVLVAQLTAL
jgi:DNA polymerase III subunit delta